MKLVKIDKETFNLIEEDEKLNIFIGIPEGGSKKKRFRKPNKPVVMEFLLGVLMVRDIKLSEFSKLVGVSHRMLQYYIYDGLKPTEEVMDKISNYLDLPKQILFYKKGD